VVMHGDVHQEGASEHTEQKARHDHPQRDQLPGRRKPAARYTKRTRAKTSRIESIGISC
jgi:hypothetical protein